MKISQSLIKEVAKPNHCPKQIMEWFVNGVDMDIDSKAMTMGRYFETELLGSCRGGVEEAAKYYSKSGNGYKAGDKFIAYQECDELVYFAKDVLTNIGLDISKGQSQLDVSTELLSAAIDHQNKDIQGSGLANYDVKWTATKEDDRWNGWADIEYKEDVIIQASHYTITSYEKTGEWLPFYFLIFGSAKWVKIARMKLSQEAIDRHYERIAYTASLIREYAENDYKGNGKFNKCISCQFYKDCAYKSTVADVELVYV